MATVSSQTLIAILIEAVHDPTQLRQSIADFQAHVFSNQDLGDDWAEEVFRDLAYDLDYYEPDPEARKQDLSYYGNGIAKARILEALSILKAKGMHIPLEGA